jgi:hypothetical protein
MPTQLTGGCACGAIRYKYSGDAAFAGNCYCRDCQRSSGAAMASVMAVPKTAFKLLKGEARYYEVTADNGNKIKRGFCSNCGSPMFALLEMMPDVVAIRAASLDDPNQFKPAVNLFMSSAPSWAPISEHLPKFPKMPG